MNDALPLQGLLQSLGWAILHSFWQMALAWLAYQLLFGWRSRLSPIVKHNAALLLLSAGGIWFIITFVEQYRAFMQVERFLALLPDAGQVPVNAAPAGALSLSDIMSMIAGFMEKHIVYLSSIYLLVLGFMAWKLLYGFFQVRLLRTRGLAPAGVPVEEKVATLARRLSISRPVRVFLSRMVDVPATLGFFKPVILLPLSSLTQLTPAQLESILLHELAHIRRFDYLLNIWISCVETMLYHNPFAWLLVRAVRRERELCCDDIVLSCRLDAVEYASALLSLEKSRSLPALSMALASNGSKGQLLNRVRRMTSAPRVSRPYTDRLMALSLFCLLMISLTWLRPGTTQAHTRSSGMPMQLKQEEVWILNEPEQNLLVKPRRKAVITKQVISGKDALTNKSIETELLMLPGETSEELSTSLKSMVFINQPPPEGYHFQFDLQVPTPAPAVPGISGFGGSPSRVELELLRALAMERMGEAREKRANDVEMEKAYMDQMGEARAQRAFDIRIKEHMDRKADILIEHKTAPAPDAMYRAYRNRAESFSGVQPAPAPKMRKPTSAGKAPVRVQDEDMRELQIMDREVIELAGALKDEQVQLARKAGILSGLRGSETVKVNRVKTRQGYVLRIETGKESIDIRIGENDIIVENRQRPE
jgi:beta-lactamase regulating signal transducer with metallopeptidase domain